MSSFIPYLDPSVPITTRLQAVTVDLGILPNLGVLVKFVDILRLKDEATYEHSARVAILGRHIAKFMHLDPKVLFYAGLLHDLGKAQTRRETLQKTSGWTTADSAEIMAHVMDGYRLIRGHFDFSAEVILWHHRFQSNSYPMDLPIPLHDYSQGTKVMIPFFGRMLALADSFDALHRVNDKHTPADGPVGEWIKTKMLEHNPDQRVLIQELYNASIFTTYTYAPSGAK